jgi:hypothetical protein
MINTFNRDNLTVVGRIIIEYLREGIFFLLLNFSSVG